MFDLFRPSFPDEKLQIIGQNTNKNVQKIDACISQSAQDAKTNQEKSFL